MRRLIWAASWCLLACSNPAPEAEPAQDSAGDEAPQSDPGMILGDDPHGEAVVAQLRAIEVTALSEWEQQVRAVLIEHYDTDGSGALDSDDEVHRVVCEVWRTLDAQLTEHSTEESLREAYGFAPGQVWQGVLGVDVSQREHLRQDLLNCGVR